MNFSGLDERTRSIIAYWLLLDFRYSTEPDNHLASCLGSYVKTVTAKGRDGVCGDMGEECDCGHELASLSVEIHCHHDQAISYIYREPGVLEDVIKRILEESPPETTKSSKIEEGA